MAGLIELLLSAVYFTLDITPEATGARSTLEEVGIYTVTNDKVTREHFFYEGGRSSAVNKLICTSSEPATKGTPCLPHLERSATRATRISRRPHPARVEQRRGLPRPLISHS